MEKHLSQNRSKSIMNKFVVSGLNKEDEKIFKKSLETAKDAVLFALENGLEKTASIYNRQKKS